MNSAIFPLVALQLDLFGSAAAPQAENRPAAGELVIATPPLRPTPPPLPPDSKPSNTTPGQQNRNLALDSLQLAYTLQRSSRRSIGFLINQQGLRVTAPKKSSLGEIERAIRAKQRWILSKLQLQRERSAAQLQPNMQWADGAVLPYLGGELILRQRSGPAAPVWHDEAAGELIVTLPADASHQFKKPVLHWLQTQALQLFAQRLPHYATQLGVRYRVLALSSATTLWGSCTARGTIRLNWRLIHVAPALIDYVIAHELSHLREMNHSPRFWATVQSVYPDYPAARRQLRALGPTILRHFE